jgi:cellulose synthase/poly-beta-1,6-N-acetylglucosamine synthase-like glycosyltransferase
MTIVAAIIFWLCVAAMFHTYVTYPLSLRLLRRRFAVPPDFKNGEWPTVAVLIPAYNEEAVIERKLENTLALDYEADKLQVLLGNDGSTDRTSDIAHSFEVDRLTIVDLPGRSGKSGVYNQLLEQTDADLVVFTDANVTLDTFALRKLVRHFIDPLVGVVGGAKYIQLPPSARSVRGEVLYGRFENALRANESAVGGMSGALGSLMAMRRRLYHPYAPGSLNDDTVPAIWATLEGLRNVYDLEAKSFEEAGRTIREEFRRRIRIGAGNWQTLFRYVRVLNPRFGIPAYTYISHKVMRWKFPFYMLFTLLACLLLRERPFYHWALIVQLAGYAAALIGWLGDLIGLRIPLFTSLYHFVALNVGLLLGFFVYLRGIRSSAWESTAREAHS